MLGLPMFPEGSRAARAVAKGQAIQMARADRKEEREFTRAVREADGRWEMEIE